MVYDALCHKRNEESPCHLAIWKVLSAVNTKELLAMYNFVKGAEYKDYKETPQAYACAAFDRIPDKGQGIDQAEETSGHFRRMNCNSDR